MEFPQDAAIAIERLHEGLRQDAALSVLGMTCAEIPLQEDAVPHFALGMRNGGALQDQYVRQSAPELLSRFALISMVSRLDQAAQTLLLQRRIIEKVAATGKGIPQDEKWPIIRQIHKEYRVGLIKLCSELIVDTPSPELLQRMKWLEGLVAIRNCLTHRLGVVQIEDLKQPGQSMEDIKESDCLSSTLAITWPV